MSNIPIWPGSSSFALVSASYYDNNIWPPPTPFGFYDTDSQFQTDANKVANFCALRLGYPIENVELQDINFWAGFEEAVTIYGNEKRYEEDGQEEVIWQRQNQSLLY